MKAQQGIVLAPVLIIIGAAVVAGTAAYLLIQAGNTNQTENSNAKYAANTNELTNTNANENANAVSNTNSTKDPTADWKTFTSSQFHVSFRYPDGFEVFEVDKILNIAKGRVYDTEIGASNAFFRISSDSYYQEDNNRLNNASTATKVIGGRTFTKVTGNDKGRYEGDSAGQVVNIALDGATIHIEERPANLNQDFNVFSLADQILSTFQFTN